MIGISSLFLLNQFLKKKHITLLVLQSLCVTLKNIPKKILARILSFPKLL